MVGSPATPSHFSQCRLGVSTAASPARPPTPHAVLDKAVTTTSVDLIFTRVKDKAARKIDFTQFKAALRLIGEAKFPGADDAYERVVAVVTTAEGPRVDAARAATDGICEWTSGGALTPAGAIGPPARPSARASIRRRQAHRCQPVHGGPQGAV